MFKAMGIRTGLVLAVVLAVSGVVAQAASACEVQNKTSKAKYTELQAAVNAAEAGQTLKVTGTCEGNTTVEKDLTIIGKSPEATTLKGTGSGSVVTIIGGVTVTVSKLTITGGKASDGGGIYNEGTLTLSKATVSGNTAEEGGGIFNEVATVTLENSTVSGNTAARGDGMYNYGGTATLNKATVSGNTATALGGGIYNLGTATLNPKTKITENKASNKGGGIYDGKYAILVEAGGTVLGNTPENLYTQP